MIFHTIKTDSHFTGEEAIIAQHADAKILQIDGWRFFYTGDKPTSQEIGQNIAEWHAECDIIESND